MRTEERREADQAIEIVCDLSKTLLEATACFIFAYDQQAEILVDLCSDHCDEALVSGLEKSFLNRLRETQKVVLLASGDAGLSFLSPALQEASAMLYPVCDEAQNLLGLMLFIREGERDFSTSEIALIDPMQRYLIKMIRESLHDRSREERLGREIVLAIYNHDALPASIYTDLKSIANSDLFPYEHFEELKHRLKTEREKSFIAICQVESIAQVEEVGQALSHTNLPVIMLGPEEDDMILRAGKFNVSSYIPLTRYSKERIEQKIVENHQKIIKNPKSSSQLSLFIGTTGGTGTTTISANLANVLSMRYPTKNILYLDFSMTKAISNIFFGIPAPEKCIVDFIHLEEYSEAQMLESGLYQVMHNLYIIPGIQSHVEREALVREEHTRKIIDMLYEVKHLFDYVIIDGGVAHDSELQIAVEEICDQVFIVTELTTIHISVLQTYYELMKKAGWKEKIKIVLNREDSQNAISVKDAGEILNSRKSKDIRFDIHIPNGGSHIRECWNFGKLITSAYPNVKFSKAIQESRFFPDIESEIPGQESKKGLLQKIFG